MTGSAHQEMDVDLETSPDLADDGWNGAAFDPELDPQGPNVRRKISPADMRH